VDSFETMQEVARQIKAAAGAGRKIAFVSGNFNVVHPGHLRLLKFATECADYLVVGINADSADTTLPEDMRLESVKAISFVNYAFIIHGSLERLITELRPTVVVKGKEHEDRDNPEQAAVESYGGKLLFGSGEVRFSSLDLLRREYFEGNFSAVKKPHDYPQRHNFKLRDLKSSLARMKDLRVIVIGDLIVDEYVECDPIGMSQEDPTVVVTPIDRKRFLGGAGIVAAHARGLGADVHYFSVAGIDDAGWFAEKMLNDYGVERTVVHDDSRPTTLKQRYRADGKTLLRVSQLRRHGVRPEIAEKILSAVEQHVATTDLMIFSDFNYGCLPQTLLEKMIALGRRHDVMMVADSQASSQIGDVSRFTDMKLLTPTEREARLALRDAESGLAVIAEELRKKARAENVIITLGPEGVLIHARNPHEWITDQLPTFNTAPKDTAGAGDSLLTCTALALCAGTDIWQSAYLGALAAACQVARVGNTPLTQAELITEIDLP